jgi:hypothetical protein
MLSNLCSFVGIKNVDENDISDLSVRRINSTPDGISNQLDNNPYSIKKSFPPFSEWDAEQLALYDYYTGETRKQLGYR